MLDADGSGALDSDEIIQAFKLINMPTSKSKITALMGDVLVNDEDAELDYEDFELLMTRRAAYKLSGERPLVQCWSHSDPDKS